MMLRSLIIAWLLCIGLAGAAQADAGGRYAEAQAYFERETQLYRCLGQMLLVELIDAGETRHALELADRYWTGRGVPRSVVQFYYWSAIAASHGHTAEIDVDRLAAAREGMNALQHRYVREVLDRDIRLSCAHTYDWGVDPADEASRH